MGLLFDTYGKRCFFLILGFVFILFGNILFIVLPNCQVGEKCFSSSIPMSMLGVGSTIVQLTLYTGFSYVVRENHFGVAFGVLMAVVNLGVLLGCLVVG